MSNILNKTISFSIALSAFFACGQAAFAADEQAQKLAKADGLMKSGKTRAAADILREFIRTNPDNAQAHMQLGAALASLVEKDEYDTAILEEQQALKLDPKSFGARIILGHIYANMNKAQESTGILKEACELRPTSYGAHRDLGIAYLTAGKIDESIAAFKKATELKPEKAEAHLKLSILLSKKGNFRDAISEANEAVQLSGDAESYLALANIMLESGDEAGSVDSFKTALHAPGSHNPMTAANALSGLGWAIAGKDASKNDMEEGVLDQKKAIRIFPPFLPAYVRLAELFSKQDNNKDAEDCYKVALKISPDDAGVATSYGKFLERIGRKDDARITLKKVVEKSPHFKAASDALAALEQGKTK